MENLFSCLCTVLLQLGNQRRFAACEGLELMTRCFNEQKYSSGRLNIMKTNVMPNFSSDCTVFISCFGHLSFTETRFFFFFFLPIISFSLFFLICFHILVCALRVVKFAISGNKTNCKRFISSGGLKHVFPMLMGRGLPKLKRKNSKSGVCWFCGVMCCAVNYFSLTDSKSLHSFR